MTWLPALFRQQQQQEITTIEAEIKEPRILPSRISVHCTTEGLVLHSTTSTARIGWGLNGQVEKLTNYSHDPSNDDPTSHVAGLVGLLRGFANSYCLLILDRNLVCSLHGHERNIYALTRVLAIPLAREEAAQVIRKHASHTDVGSDEESSASDEEVVTRASTEDPPLPSIPSESVSSPIKSRKKPFAMGAYFWPSPSTARQQTSFSPINNLSKPASPHLSSPSDVASGIISENAEPQEAEHHLRETSSADSKAKHVAEPSTSATSVPTHRQSLDSLSREISSRQNLDHKLVREAIRELEKGMWFSYDHDATHNLQHKATRNSTIAKEIEEMDSKRKVKKKGSLDEKIVIEKQVLDEPDSHVPLWKRADERFWWNRWLSQPFVAQGLDDFVYPIFQGYVGTQSITWTPTPPTALSAIKQPSIPQTLNLFIISRRSIERPGLRYQRRGINSDGGTANFVETEFIASTEQHGETLISSFVQTRGSIPLFWSQSPWALKPVPVLERSAEDNAAAIKKHFSTLLSHYGHQTVVNLAEQSGKEGVVVKAYEEAVKAMDDSAVKYVGFDFHKECKGMRYENITRLTDQLEDDLKQHDFFWSSSTEVLSNQIGTFRTNCMDCLDRTNVVQSAIARKFLSTTLQRFGIELLTNPAANTQLETIFNELWAANGDAISQEYAGTSALKGDFTRTGQRNWRGVVNDASNSIARLWQNTILDFFKQSMLDYVLGINLYSFNDFQQKLSTTDPGELHRLAAIRSTAIETCSTQLLTQGEKRQAGWTLLSPSDDAEEGHIPTEGFEEKVLLLSEKAVYIISYEYSLQKVRDFVRIPLLCVTSIQHGAFVLSTLSSFSRDEKENYGFVLEYNLMQGEGLGSDHVESKANTYSIRTSRKTPPLPTTPAGETKKALFKAMRRDMPTGNIGDRSEKTGEATVLEILDQIAKASKSIQEHEIKIEEKEIRSLQTALASESVFNIRKILHSIEHYIWL